MNDDEYRYIRSRLPEDAEADEEYAAARSAMRKRRRRSKKRSREREIRLRILVLAAFGIMLALAFSSGIVKRSRSSGNREKNAENAVKTGKADQTGEEEHEEQEEKEEQRKREILTKEQEELLSDSVLQYLDLMEYYAEEEGIEEYVPVLMAIMETETKGERDDVMQSSESAGLDPGTLGPEDSIAQACDYFRGLVARAEDLGCDTSAVIQAYNYGPGYLYYVAEHGGRHSFDLAVDYAEEMSDGRTAGYTHYIADDYGNWMYLYGNMYFVKLVEQYLP